MSRPGRTKLVPQITQPSENQNCEALEESSLVTEQKEEPKITELEHEIECPRCSDIMELISSFDTLAYSCENCSFLLKCV